MILSFQADMQEGGYMNTTRKLLTGRLLSKLITIMLTSGSSITLKSQPTRQKTHSLRLGTMLLARTNTLIPAFQLGHQHHQLMADLPLALAQTTSSIHLDSASQPLDSRLSRAQVEALESKARAKKLLMQELPCRNLYMV